MKEPSVLGVKSQMTPSINVPPPDIVQEVRTISGPAIEPVSLAEVLAQARIDVTVTAEEALIGNVYIPACREYLEHRTGRTFHEKTLEWMLSGFPAFGKPIRLLHATSLNSITTVTYYDSAGTPTVWPSSNYIADTFSRVGRLVPAYNVPYPCPVLYPVWPVRILGTAGIATTSPATDAPSACKQAMLLLVAAAWENREAEHIPDRNLLKTLSLEYGVESFIYQLKREFAF
jgi:uncharacterized phiE125 gp8 family phage protein